MQKGNVYLWKMIGLGVYLFMMFIVLASGAIGTTPTYIAFTLFNLAVMPIILLPHWNPFVGILQGACLIFLAVFFTLGFGIMNVFVFAEIFFIAGSVLAINILRFKKTRKPQSEATEFGFIVSDNAYIHPGASLPFWMRVLPIVAFAVLLAFAAMAQIQLVPYLPAFGLTPEQMADTGMSMRGTQDAFLSSFPIGFAEDGVNLALVMTIVMWLSFIVYEWLDAQPNPVFGLGFIVVGCLLGAAIFTAAHYTNPAYIGNTTAIQAAFGFSFINQLLFGLTGIFLPLPHIFHNFFIVLSRYQMIAMLPIGVGAGG